jgi:hypothetical protein
VRAAAITGAIPFGAHAGVVVNDGVEDRREQPALGAGVAAKAVQDELGDRRVSHQVGPAEHLQVTGDGGLREVEDCLEVGDEERRSRQAIEDPEPGRLRDGQEEARGR